MAKRSRSDGYLPGPGGSGGTAGLPDAVTFTWRISADWLMPVASVKYAVAQ